MRKTIAVLLAVLLLASASKQANSQEATGTMVSTPQGLTNYASFTIGGKVYVGSGYYNYTSNCNTSTVNNASWYVFDPATNVWSTIASFPGAQRNSGFVCFSIGNKGYFGLGTNSGDWWEYDPTQNTWTAKASIPAPVFYAAGMTIGQKGYVIGGRQYVAATGSYIDYVDATYEYNPTTNTWTARAALPEGRIQSAGFALGGKAYVVAGYGTSGQLSSTYAFDPVANTWAQKSACPYAGASKIGFSLNDYGYVATIDKYMVSYNPTSDQWTSATQLNSGSITYLPTEGGSRQDVVRNKVYLGMGLYSTYGTSCYQYTYQYQCGGYYYSCGCTTYSCGTWLNPRTCTSCNTCFQPYYCNQDVYTNGTVYNYSRAWVSYGPLSSITVSSMPATACPGAPVTIGFTADGVSGGSNVFTAELSDASGSFSSATVFGTITNLSADAYGTVTGSITANFPELPTGTGYRVRVKSSSGAVTGTTSLSALAVLGKPVVTFTESGSNSYCNPNTVLYTNTTAGSVSNTWTFGNATSTDAVTTQVYASAGTYPAKLVVTNSNGCKDSLSRNVVVKQTPEPDFTINNNTQCAGTNAFTFTSTTTNAVNATYAWNYGDGTTATGTSGNKTFAAAGTYTVTLNVDNGNGCSKSISKTVTVLANPVAAFTVNNGTQCLNGNDFAFTNASTGTDISNAWTLGNGSTTSGSDAQVSYTAAGTYPVKLVVQSGNGCKDSATQTVTVLASPVAAYTVNSATQCDNSNQFDFNNQSTGAATYAWTLGDGNTASTGNASHTYTTAGTYSVQLLAVAANGCRDSIRQDVSVLPSYPATIRYTGTPYCNATGTATISRVGTSGGTYSATPAGLSIDPQTGAIDLAASQPGVYTVRYGNGSSSLCGAATTEVAVRPNQFMDMPANVTACAGSTQPTITFNGLSGLSYSWINSNTAVGLGASGNGAIPAFTAMAGSVTESAYVAVTANGGTGCSFKSNTFRLLVMPRPTMSTPASITVCSGGTTPAINFSGTQPGTIFSWTNSVSAIGLIPAGTGNINSFVAVNNSATAQTAQIMVTPYVNQCAGDTRSFSITVQPGSGSISYPNAAYCQGGWAYAQSSGTTGGTFTATPAGLALSATTGAVNLGTSAAGTYTVTYTSIATGGCSVSSSTGLTVLPQATVNVMPNPVYCTDAAVPATVFTGTAASYTWTNNNPSIGLPASGTGNLPAFTAINTGSTVQYANITVTPVGGANTNCTGKAMSFRITVNPIPSVNAVSNQLYCRGVVTSSTTFSGPVTGTTYNWTNSNVAIGLAGRGSNSIPSFTTQNATAGPLTATIVVTPVANRCTGAAATYTISVGNCVTIANGGSTGSQTSRTAAAPVVSSSLTVGPNPTNENVRISGNDKGQVVTAIVYDAKGVRVTDASRFSDYSHTISLRGLAAGSYLVVLSDNSGKELMRRYIQKL